MIFGLSDPGAFSNQGDKPSKPYQVPLLTCRISILHQFEPCAHAFDWQVGVCLGGSGVCGGIGRLRFPEWTMNLGGLCCVSPQIHMATLVGTIFVINPGIYWSCCCCCCCLFQTEPKIKNVPWLWYVFPYRMVVSCSSMGVWPHSIL